MLRSHLLIILLSYPFPRPDRQLAELLKERHEARDLHKREARRAKFQEMVRGCMALDAPHGATVPCGTSTWQTAICNVYVTYLDPSPLLWDMRTIPLFQQGPEYR